MHSSTPAIPGYEILDDDPLGAGGFARVYLAQHIGLQIKVALKVMDGALAEDLDFCKRFLQEARTCAGLGNHPNIIHIYDVGCIDNLFYIAMQYLPGPNLRDVLDDDEPYAHPLVLLRPIVDALGYAHEHGIVHRDVKPANILFNEAGRAMLVDFGIAKSLRKENTQLTIAGTAIGTAAYMSPEQAKGLARIDGRSDLYSIGVLLYEMLCGEQPYQADDQMGMMLQHVNDPIPQLPESERHYQPLITGLMAKEPDDRYQDHKAVLADMDALLLLLEEPVIQEKKPVWKSLAVTGLAALMLALVAGFAWLQYDSSAPDTDNSAVQNELGNDELNRSDDSDESSASTQSTDSPKIARMLELAKVHEEFNELVAPPGSNALELYEAILREDPSHEFAALRIEAIKQLTGN